MSLDSLAILAIALVILGTVAIIAAEYVLGRWWQRLWKRAEPKKRRDPWTDRTGI